MLQLVTMTSEFCSSSSSVVMVRTKHAFTLNSFCSQLGRRNPFGNGFVPPRYFELDDGETLYVAEIPSNVKGGTRYV